ncbi:hypothetical protein EFQ43_14030, partial [Limosilactobacillus fermentum]|nr:hypothetical protein [Limosilactobacillus fermentum]
RKQKKGGVRCKHRPPPKMTHQQDLTKSPIFLLVPTSISNRTGKIYQFGMSQMRDYEKIDVGQQLLLLCVRTLLRPA